MRGTEATTSCSPSSPHAAVTVEATTSLSLSHTLSLTRSLYTRYTTSSYKSATTNSNVLCPKSYLYIYDFRVIYTCVPSNRSGRIGTGSSVIRFSLSSIRRDLFPNNSLVLPQHEMGKMWSLMMSHKHVYLCYSSRTTNNLT